MKAHFSELARYNRWANRRLYEVSAELSSATLWGEIGLFFHSLGGTLNHLLVADRVWMKRFTGEGDHPDRLDAILFPVFDDLKAARTVEDERIVSYVDGLCETDFDIELEYNTITNPRPIRSVLKRDLTHFFNHQTHHRGQAHTALSLLTQESPPSFDMILFHRGVE